MVFLYCHEMGTIGFAYKKIPVNLDAFVDQNQQYSLNK